MKNLSLLHNLRDVSLILIAMHLCGIIVVLIYPDSKSVQEYIVFGSYALLISVVTSIWYNFKYRGLIGWLRKLQRFCLYSLILCVLFTIIKAFVPSRIMGNGVFYIDVSLAYIWELSTLIFIVKSGVLLPNAVERIPEVIAHKEIKTHKPKTPSIWYFGIVLIFIGVLCFLEAMTMDVSVGFNDSVFSKRINNIGLMNKRQNLFIVGGIFLLLGLYLTFKAKEKLKGLSESFSSKESKWKNLVEAGEIAEFKGDKVLAIDKLMEALFHFKKNYSELGFENDAQKAEKIQELEEKVLNLRSSVD